MGLHRFSGAPGQGRRRRSGAIGLALRPVLLTPGRLSARNDGSVGQTYALTPAIWSFGIAQRRWYRETVDRARLRTMIAGATAATYIAQAADVGHRILCVETNGASMATVAAIGPVLAAPLLLDAMDSHAGYVVSGAPDVADDGLSRVQGASAIRIARSPTGGQLTKANIGAVDPAALGTLAYWYRAGEGDPELAQVGPLNMVALGQNSSYAGTITDGSSEGNANQNDYRALNGAWMAMHVAESATIAAYSPAQPLGVRINPAQTNAPGNGVIHVDALMARAGGRPTIVLGFDDALANQYAVIAPLLEARGLRGTFYLPTANIGADANRMSQAQVIDLAARGHDLQLDATSSDAPIGTGGFTSMAVLLDDLATQRAWFQAQSLPTPEHVCYPNGVHRIPGARIQLTGVAFNATDQCIVPSAAGVAVGMKVTAHGLPRATTVTAIAGTTISLSHVSSQSGSLNATFVAASGPFHTGKVQTALAAAGIRSGRTTVGGSWYTRMGPSGRAMVHPAQTTSGQSAAQMQAAVDVAILRGTTLEFYIHAATANPIGTEVGLAHLTALLDYLIVKRDAGVLDILTKAEWWARDGGAGVPL